MPKADEDSLPCGVPPGHMTLEEICADFARREAQRKHRAAVRGMTRRAFLEMVAASAAATAVVGAAATRRSLAEEPAEEAAVEPAEGPATALPRSRVVLVTHPEVLIRGYRVNPPIVRQMLDRALLELFGAAAEKDAWLKVGHEGDFVAVKHNSIGRPTLHSHTEINDAVTEQLAVQAGVSPEKMLVVDRRMPEPYMDLSEPFTLPSTKLGTCLRRLYTDHATAIVNVSVLKCHFNEGVSAAMKNHLGSVNNPAAYHGWEPDRMPRSLPELNALEPLRSKTRLCIVDAVRPLFAAGPADNEEYRWDYRGLIVGTDPVAVTAVGVRILEARRHEALEKEWPMTAARQMVAYGQAIGLGNADPDRIDLVEVDMG